MENCGIICEYNPFHNGHKYQLDCVKNHPSVDKIICVTSGNFCQRNEPAVLDKYSRARIAIQNGADAVIELPLHYATAAAPSFAEGGIAILNALKDIRYVAMGHETESPELLESIADIQYLQPPLYKTALKEALDSGVSYPSAIAGATVLVCEKAGFDGTVCDKVLRFPNNLLCIEYLKAIKRLNSPLKPLFIQRVGSYYNSENLDSDYPSATALRKLIGDGQLLRLKNFVPSVEYDTLCQKVSNRVDYKLFENILLYALKTATPESIEKCPDCMEGLGHKLIDCAVNGATLASVLSAAKSKRYTYAKLRRLALQNALSITGDLFNNDAPYRILAVKSNFKSFLSETSANRQLYIQNSELSRFEPSLVKILRNADLLYDLITNEERDTFYSSPLICE